MRVICYIYVTAIILCYTKNIYKICNCKPHHESKFPNEYIGVLFIQIDQHLKKLFKKIQRVPDFLEHGVYSGFLVHGTYDLETDTSAFLTDL